MAAMGYTQNLIAYGHVPKDYSHASWIFELAARENPFARPAPHDEVDRERPASESIASSWVDLLLHATEMKNAPSLSYLSSIQFP